MQYSKKTINKVEIYISMNLWVQTHVCAQIHKHRRERGEGEKERKKVNLISSELLSILVLPQTSG